MVIIQRDHTTKRPHTICVGVKEVDEAKSSALLVPLRMDKDQLRELVGNLLIVIEEMED